MGKTIILHLSDLHIRQDQDHPSDQEVVLDPLIDRVKDDRDSGLIPELIMVTGDVAFKGDPREYEIAAGFLDRLCGVLDLARDRVFIVPGNHDVNRKAYRPADNPSYETMRDLNLELENPDYREDLFKGLNAYFGFIGKYYGHLASLAGHLIPFVRSYGTRCGKSLGIMGLNSAWKCRKSPDAGDAAIGEFQIKKAKRKLDEKGPYDLQLACFHHPLGGLWEKDQAIARRHLDGCLVLTGHLHKAGGAMIQDIGGQLYTCAAGGAYLGSDSSYPMGYHYLTVDWDTGRLVQNFRTFDAGSHRWIVDAHRGDDGASTIPCPFINCEKSVGGRDAPPDPKVHEGEVFDGIPENFCELLKDHCNFMEADRLQEKGNAITLSLPELFIPLYTDDPDVKTGRSRDAEEDALRLEKERKTVDLEALIGREEILVIAGKPGSGKTTLLKHLTHSIAEKGASIPKGVAGFFPALIFLKRLAHGLPETGLTLETIFEAYYTGERRDLGRIAMAAARQGRCLFMLDGLDEMGEKARNDIVECLADFRILHPGNKFVLAGRPHGISAKVRQRFQREPVMVNDLNREQTNRFIQKWFFHLFAAQPSQGRDRAEDLIRQMASNDQLKELVDTPLMLTAICILYHHGKRLPKHRAELYQRFIDHLIHSRFEEAEKVKGFLSGLAHQMQRENRAETDRNAAVEALGGKYLKNSGESQDDHRIRIEREFDRMEPRCGLLEAENGAYKFRHLTFQEFLAAVHIMDTTRDYINTLKSLWYLDHYRETLALLIALLSLNNNKVWANDLVREGLNLNPKEDFLPWRTAIRGFLDIHRDRQEPEIVTLAGKKILEMIAADITPEQRAEAGRNLCALGDPRDLKAWIKIPAGRYLLSAGEEESEKVDISSFELAQYPVTNGWFAEFMDAGGYTCDDCWTPEGLKWRERQERLEPGFWRDKEWNLVNHPVIGVCWYEAQAFCNWLTFSRDDGYTYRLPIEKEWEAAAAGLKGRKYPWGDAFQKGICNSREAGVKTTSAVGVFLNAATPEGLMDMAGNVWEWTCTDFHHSRVMTDFPFDGELQALYDQKKWNKFFDELKNEKRRLPALRGGSWSLYVDLMACRARGRNHPVLRYSVIGFRIARTQLTL